MIAFFLTMPMSRITPISAMIDEFRLNEQQRKQRAHARRRQRRQDRERMHLALVQHAEHDVDREYRREDQPRLAVERRLERARGALEAAVQRRRHADLRHRRVDCRDGIPRARRRPAG